MENRSHQTKVISFFHKADEWNYIHLIYSLSVHYITLWLINEHHTTSIKHMVNRSKATMDSIYTES